MIGGKTNQTDHGRANRRTAPVCSAAIRNYKPTLSLDMELKRVVVTGLGAITPIGNDVPTTWENAINGVSGAGPITHFDASLFKTQFACEVKNFVPSEHFDRKEARKYDLYAMYALVAANQAIADADLDAEGIDKDRVGVIFAAGIGGLHTFEEEAGYYAKNEEKGQNTILSLSLK